MENNSHKILICEDDPLLRSMYVDQFKLFGFTVFNVSTGDKVIPAMLEHKPDLVLLDMIMPLKMGYEILEELRSDLYSELQKIPVVLLSNIGQQEVVDKAMGLGAVAYLVKSQVTPKEITEKVRIYLQ